MKIEAVTGFIDLEKNKVINKGDKYDVTKERAKVLVDAGFVKVIDTARKTKD